MPGALAKYIAIAATLLAANTLSAQDITQLGGDLTSSLPAQAAVTLPAPNISSKELFNFHLSGFVEFNRSFLLEKKNGKFVLGPHFNHDSCGSCHVGDGKGHSAFPPNADGSAMLIKVSLRGLNADRSARDVPGVGEQLQDHTIKGKKRFDIKLAWKEIPGVYPDGTPYSLRKPLLSFKIPTLSEARQKRVLHSLRMSPSIIGMGLLEAVSKETLEAMSDPADVDLDGVSGRVSYVLDKLTGKSVVGRFGFKASHPDLQQQSAAAFFNDMGMTNQIFKGKDSEPEVSAESLGMIVFYQQAAGVPPARNQDDPKVIAGKAIFQNIGCDDCHKMTLTTGDSSVQEVSNQIFHPFTDLLLHDMGPSLSDERPEFSASGREWRTTPLWGLGLLEEFSTVRPTFLHDGRARSLEEAILWHGGEAAGARNRFKALQLKERKLLIRFLRSL